jgi:adenylosuccinate lyase
VVDEERVRGNLEATNGQIYAEAIQYALSDHMKSDSAKNLVKEACRVAKMNKENLFDQIMKTTDFPIDWAQLRDPRTHLGSSEAFITRVLGAVRDGKPDGE